jgi:hypothetical protein
MTNIKNGLGYRLEKYFKTNDHIELLGEKLMDLGNIILGTMVIGQITNTKTVNRYLIFVGFSGFIILYFFANGIIILFNHHAQKHRS